MYVYTAIQTQDFDWQAESARLQAGVGAASCGALSSFVGLVRADAPASVEAGEGKASVLGALQALFLQHYPGMSERCLQDLAQTAGVRFGLQGITILHRIGHLTVGERIVLVLAAAAHRKAALQAVDFVMDRLKSTIPLWKREDWEQGSTWVQAKSSDAQALAQWV